MKTVPFEEIREDSSDKLEFVVLTPQLALVSQILSDYFGVPVKPAGANPSGQSKELTENFGGILKRQTLYYIENEGYSNLAMIWPWSDETCATVKIFRLNKK